MAEVPRFTIEEGTWAIVRLAPEDPVPAWAESAVFASVTRTRDELSVVCPESAVPEGVRAERGWALLKLQGPFPFTAVGILASLAAPLARAGVPIFVISTFDTDYLLCSRGDLGRAVEALERAQAGEGEPRGSAVRERPPGTP